MVLQTGTVAFQEAGRQMWNSWSLFSDKTSASFSRYSDTMSLPSSGGGGGGGSSATGGSAGGGGGDGGGGGVSGGKCGTSPSGSSGAGAGASLSIWRGASATSWAPGRDPNNSQGDVSHLTLMTTKSRSFSAFAGARSKWVGDSGEQIFLWLPVC